MSGSYNYLNNNHKKSKEEFLFVLKNGGINFLITDAGMQTLIRPAMYGAVHRIEVLNDLEKEKVIYTIAGPICESSDIISKDIQLPMQKEENYLAIHDVGAYGAVMGVFLKQRLAKRST